jgi:hypothetical protein
MIQPTSELLDDIFYKSNLMTLKSFFNPEACTLVMERLSVARFFGLLRLDRKVIWAKLMIKADLCFVKAKK